ELSSRPTLQPLALHDALPISALLVEAVHADRHADAGERDAVVSRLREHFDLPVAEAEHLVELAEGRFAAVLDDWIFANAVRRGLDRKSTRLNSSHVKTSYAGL